jgi:transcriptional regulator with GAF, ATPase, and Fis domain
MMPAWLKRLGLRFLRGNPSSSPHFRHASDSAESSRPPRLLVLGSTVGVIAYSLAVIWCVRTTADLGLRCVFGTKVKEQVAWSDGWLRSPRDFGSRPAGLRWSPRPPEAGDSPERPGATLLMIRTRDGDHEIRNYTDYIKALRDLRDRAGQVVEVWWAGADGVGRYGQVELQCPPPRSYVWSIIWFLQEMIIFVVGARVYWKRPRDDSARLFFWLCVVTVGAFMGGYHWSQIVVHRPLIFAFAAFAVFVPILSLHFYLVFPRPIPFFDAHRRRVLQILYGVPAACLAGLWASMAWSTWDPDRADVVAALFVLRNLALGYVALAVAIFVLCLGCLVYSFRTVPTRAERNQVKYILLATLLALLPIAYLLWDASSDPARLGLARSAWPMFVVSLLYTAAYALSITRYKLMQAEEYLNRGGVYFLVSLVAGLLYSGLLVVTALVINLRVPASQLTIMQALVAGLTAIVILVLTEAARQQFQKALDRRFYREKSKFDQAMRKMSLAVGSLVDRPTLGRRLLEAAAEVFRLEWGAIYVAEADSGPLTLVAGHGPEPDERALAPDNPLVERLRQEPGTIRVPHAMAAVGASDPATDAMIALGGEVATALEADGRLAGLLVLGPKRSGMPYEDEELAFLGALGSVATLALHSAGIQQTLEALNHELRDKVDKIAEQQRRILILQDQLTGRVEAAEGSKEKEREGQLELPPEPAVFGAIKGSGRAVRRMLELARKVAASPSAVLIRGESGTGKELLAEAIHAASPRAGGPFVKVHCAALSQGLLESELFGHVKGAFTGADRDRVGRFQQADGGTLFLDEIGDINIEVQTKLLRVLQEMAFERVGSSQAVTADVRILAATHQDLESLIAAGRFREDLYYRLNVISLRTPALRERKEDIFELAVYFLGHHARRIGKAVTHLDDGAIEALTAYDWPGNIRELENVIERAVVLSDGPALTRDDLPPEVRRPARRRRLAVPVAADALSLAPSRSSSWDDQDDDEPDAEADAYERRRLLDALEGTSGNKSEAARLLGMPRSTFFSKLKKHGLA